MENKIKKIDELLQDYIGPNKTIVEKTFGHLTEPGENYLSDMVKIHVVLRNKKTGASEELNVVAKCVVDMEFGPTFLFTKNEINIYKRVIPTLQKFQERHGVTPMDFFPKFIGGRLNLNGSPKPDKDAVLVLENLKVQGYINLDRHIGFSLAESKLVLKSLATFHSTVIVLKLLEPETFKTEIKDICDLGPPQMSPKKVEGKPLDRPGGNPPGEQQFGPPNFYPAILQYIKSVDKFSQVVQPLINLHNQMEEEMKDFTKFFNRPIPEPFGSLLHSDMWINNIMLKIQDGVIQDIKMFDFQMSKLDTPVIDLIFFLASSVQSAILRTDFENLIKYYYENFKDNLKQFGCYESQFSYQNFEEELKKYARFPIGKCMMMLPNAVFTEKGKKFDSKKGKTIEDLPELAKERLGILFLEAVNRGWMM